MTGLAVFLTVVLAVSVAAQSSDVQVLSPEWIQTHRSTLADRHVALTPCSLFIDQRSAPVDTMDKLLQVELGYSGDLSSLRVGFQSRFLSSSAGDILSLVGSDLFVGVTDGEKVVGFMRSTVSADGSWGVPTSGSLIDGQLVGLTMLESFAAQCDKCTFSDAEFVDLTMNFGPSGTTMQAKNLAGAISPLANFPEFLLSAQAPLSLVVFLGAWDHAYELGGFVVDVNPLNTLYSNIMPGFTLLGENGEALGTTSFGTGRTLGLVEGCSVQMGRRPAMPGFAFQKVMQVPLVAADAMTNDKAYRVTMVVDATPLSEQNNFVVGLVDASGAVMGFERSDASSGNAGSAFGASLTPDGTLVKEGAYVEVSVAGAALERAFAVNVLLQAGKATRVIVSHTAGSFEVSLPGSLDVASGLSLVLLQSVRNAESTLLSSVAVVVDEVAIGCDGVANSGKVVDLCGACDGLNECVGCDGVPNSGLTVDECGECGGAGLACRDCMNVMHGTSKLDACGICNGNNACLRTNNIAEQMTEVRHQLEARSEYHALLRDCEGVPLVMGGNKKYDDCGVCGGDNACFGCDGVAWSGMEADVCGVCGGDGTTCCHNYLGVENEVWDFLLLPVTIEDLVEKFEYTHDLLYWINDNLPSYEQVSQMQPDLMIGTMAEFNRIFLEECLCEFCEKSSAMLNQLVHTNFADHQVRFRQNYIYDGPVDNFAYPARFHDRVPSAGDFPRSSKASGYGNHQY